MNSEIDYIKSEAVQAWIEEHLSADLRKVALQKTPFATVSMIRLVEQLQGRKIAKQKFELLDKPGIIFPPKLNLEQTSSSATAAYKSNIISGKTIMDANGGLGIDSIYFAQQFDDVMHIELNPNLQPIAASNFDTLGLKQIRSFNADFADILAHLDETIDVIYLDPSRRDENKNKVFLLNDLQPNILEIQDLLLAKGKTILIKLSPLLDIKYLIEQIQNLSEIHIVAVKNEVKELLLKIDAQAQNATKIISVNLSTDQDEFSFDFDDLSSTDIPYADLEKYVYEPNVAVRKSGGMDIMAAQLKLKKLHPNTQLYTSDDLIPNFAGRVFEVQEKVKNPKKELKNRSIMAIHRNFPQSLVKLKKQFSFHLDGTQPVLFTQSINLVSIYFMKEVFFVEQKFAN